MSLVRVSNVTPAGAYFAPKALKGIVEIEGVATINYSRFTVEEKRRITTAIERGYSRGNARNTVFCGYALVCMKFDIPFNSVGNGRWSNIALAGRAARAFEHAVRDALEPVYQLASSDKHHAGILKYMYPRNILGQDMLQFQKHPKAPMNIFGKVLTEKLIQRGTPEQRNAAVMFVNEGRTIRHDLKTM